MYLPAVFLGTVVVVLVTLGVSDLLSSAESVRFCLLGGGAFLVLSLVVDGLDEKKQSRFEMFILC